MESYDEEVGRVRDASPVMGYNGSWMENQTLNTGTQGEWMRCFVRKHFGMSKGIECHRGSLLGKNLYGIRNWDRRNEGVVMSASMNDFQTYAVNIINDVKNSDRTVHHA